MLTNRLFEKLHNRIEMRFICLVGEAPAAPAGGGGAPPASEGSSGSPPASGNGGASALPSDPSSPKDSNEPDEDVFKGFDQFLGSDPDDDTASPATTPTNLPAGGVGDTGAPRAPAAAAPPAQTAGGQQPPQPAAPAAPPPVAASAPTPPGPVQTPPAAAEPAAPELSWTEPDRIAAAMTQNRDAVIDHLAKSGRFAVTPEELQGLEEDAATTLPKIMARTFVEAHTSMMNFVAQAVPQMIQRGVQQQVRIQRNESEFYAAWKGKGIDRNTHHEVVGRYARAYRQANPTATKQQLIASVGAMVLAELGLPLSQPNSGAPPSPPVAPTNGSRAAPRAVQPFTPAVGGGAGQPRQPAEAQPGDEWSGFAGEYEDEG